MKSLKNAILWAMTSVMVGVFFLSLASVDSPSWYPFIGLLISGAYIVMFCYANGMFEVGYEDDEEEDDEDVRY